MRSDAGEGRIRAASWLRDFSERLRGPGRAHFNGLDVGHGARRGRKMPTATSSCSRCAPAKIIAGVNQEGAGTAWPARGAMRGHGSHAAATARRQRISISTALFHCKRNDPDAGLTGCITTRVNRLIRVLRSEHETTSGREKVRHESVPTQIAKEV